MIENCKRRGLEKGEKELTGGPIPSSAETLPAPGITAKIVRQARTA